MERDPDKTRLEELDRRLSALAPPVPAAPAAGHSSPSAGAGTGARLVTELLAGILGGLLLGWFIDRQAGTGPWALLAGLVLGAAAAMNNVLKEARRTSGVPRAGPRED